MIRGVGWAMIWAGVLIFAFLAWQLWGTGLITAAEQNDAAEEVDTYFEDVRSDLVEEVDEVPDQVESVPITDEGLVDESAIELEGPAVLTDEPIPSSGEAFAVLSFPSLGDTSSTGDADLDDLVNDGLTYVVREGEDLANLRRGPGHYAQTPIPGQWGNSAIAGHRTTYGAPFNRLDEIRAGDPIIIETAIGAHVYIVRDPREIHDESRMLDVGDDAGWMAVDATALWVVDPLDGAFLTLTTCHPEFSSRQRLVVVAELVSGPNARYFAEQGGV